MKKYLELTIQLISLVSALGVVLSIFIYSYVFGLNGVSYLGIASFSDVLRDSLQVLVFSTIILFATALMFGLANYAIRTEKFTEGHGDRDFTLRAAKYAAPLGIATFLFLHVSGSISNDKPPEMVSFTSILITTCVALSAFGMFYDVFKTHSNSNSNKSGDAVVYMKRGMAVFIACLMLYSAFSTVSKQFDKGIRADVYPLDKNLCAGRYTTVWLGENRMVARCEKNKRMVVQVLNWQVENKP